MNYTGVLIGLFVFIIIGVFHPIVIKAEYYFTSKCWVFFLIAGILFLILSLVVDNKNVSILLGVVGFSSFWSIHEIKEQEERVKKGWFPKNPNR